MKYYTPLLYMLGSLILLVLFVLSTYGATLGLYNLKDLEILSEEKNYQEFLDHAMDIRPINRTPHWQEMVYKCAENFLNEIIDTQQFTSENLKYIEKLTQWQTLRNNEIFQLKRARFGLKFFSNCFLTSRNNFQEVTRCKNEMQIFWKNTPKDFINLQLGIDLADLSKLYSPETDLSFFYAPILLNKYAGTLCEKEELLVYFLEQIKKEFSYDIVMPKFSKVIDQYVSPSCFETLSPLLKQKLQNSPDPKFNGLMLAVLQSKNMLAPGETDYYLVRYILDGPSNGYLLNHAWNTLNNLGQDHKRREQVMIKFKQSYNLPGNLFKIDDQERLKTIMSLVSKNIPEYLDHYAITCIKYLKGELLKHSGSPTPGCHDLFKKAEKENWLPQHFKQSYKQSL